MSNIKTLKDLDGVPNEPLENPWSNPKKYGGVGRSTAGGYTDGGTSSYSEQTYPINAGNQQQLPYVGVDGSTKILVGEELTFRNTCSAMCMPCFVSGMCSTQRKQEYYNLFKTFMFIITVVEIIMLIASLSFEGFAPLSYNNMIGPPAQPLITLGCKFPYLMRYKLQLWRFFVPMVLHAGIIHLFFNAYAQLRICLIYEREWGFITSMAIFFVSGTGGIIMSSLIQYQGLAVGASGAIMGMIGARLNQLIFGSEHLARRNRYVEIGQIIFFVFATFMLSFVPFIDWSGHLGGIISGFLFGGSLFESNRKYLRIIMIVLCITYFIGSIILFYTVIPVPNYYFYN